MRLRTWIFSAVWLLCALDASAQHWKFQMFGAEEGLTNLTVLALSQDRQGFLWISTEAGIFRYDGDSFQRFGSDPVANRGDTHCFYTASDGQMLVGSSLGLFRWTGEHFAPVRGFEDIEVDSGQAIASDAQKLYVATSRGVWWQDLHSPGTRRQVSAQPAVSVFLASDQTLWFSCDAAICALRNGRRQRFSSPDGVPAGPWWAFAEDAAGRIWIRSDDRVLVRDTAGGRFHPVPGLPSLGSTYHAMMTRTRRGELLIPHDAGLAICQGTYCENYNAENGLEHTGVISAIEDREGSLWLGYSGHGLGRWLGRAEWQGFGENEGLSDPGLWRIVHNAQNQVWVGTSHGLFQGVAKGSSWRFRRTDAVDQLTVYGLAAENDGSLWVGTFQSQIHGVVRYYPATHRKVIYPPAQPFPQFAVYDICRDPSGTVWVATPKGVMRLPPGARQLQAVPLPIDGAPAYEVRSNGDDLYVASKNGLYIQREGIRRLLTRADGLKDTRVQSVEAGPDGALWIDYFSSTGITRVDLSGGRVQLQHFTVENGLPSNVVYSQFFDSRHRHWLGTDDGVAVYERGRWKHYDTSDGLIWNDLNAHAYLAEPDGGIWFGTSAGLSRFQEVAPLAPMLPSTLITSVLRDDIATPGTVFDGSLHSLGLRYTMLSYLHSKPQFRYRLGTGREPWNRTQGREVHFAALPAGNYQFEVQGEVEPGLWSQPAVLNFRIKSPWYRAWPAEVGFVSVVALLFWLWWWRREARQQRIRAELEVAVDERTRDLTAARARAEEASRVKGEFVANMSHEMRTPLNAVIGFTHLALQVARQAEVIEYLDNVHLSAKSLLNLINDVLDFSKMESGRVKLSPSAFAVRPFIAEVIAILGAEAARKKLELKHHVDGAVPEWVLADHDRLRQVLMNLMGNSLKFTPRGGVTLAVGYSGSLLEFAVSDTGIGIPREKQELIFEAFQQADNSTSRRYGGTGLGLTISKRLVESLGGELGVTSEPGVGSVFRFSIQAPLAAASPPLIRTSQQPPVRSLHILVAEDNRVNQRLITALLRKRGHQTAVVENGVEALAALQADPFDLVLMDIQMPEMDGLEAVRRIREGERESGRRLPVVAMTARAMAGDREAILAAGMDDYLEKPVRLEQLDAILRQASSPPSMPLNGYAQSGGLGQGISPRAVS